jgi:hypothetical protein
MTNNAPASFAADLRFQTTQNGSTAERMRIHPSGYVSINNTNQTGRLTVSSANGDPAIYASGSGTGDGGGGWFESGGPAWALRAESSVSGGALRVRSYNPRSNNHTGAEYIIDATSTLNSLTKTGLSLSSTGSWSGTGSVNRGLVVDVSGGTTNYAALFTGGNVGIGTTTPQSAVHIRQSLPELFIDNTNSVTTANAQIGRLTFGDARGSNVRTAEIRAVRDAASSGATDLPTRLEFYTTPDGTDTPQMHMQIGNDGRVYVRSDIHHVADNGQLIIHSSRTPFDGAYLLMNGGDHVDPGQAFITHGNFTAPTVPASSFRVRYAANSVATDQFIIDHLGNAALGTTTNNTRRLNVRTTESGMQAVRGENTYSGSIDGFGIFGRSVNVPGEGGYGVGGRFEGGWRGIDVLAGETGIYVSNNVNTTGIEVQGVSGTAASRYAFRSNIAGTATTSLFGIQSNVTTAPNPNDYAVYGYTNNTGGSGYGVYGWTNANTGSNFAYGVYGRVSGTVGTRYAGYFDGNLHTTGTLSKAAGTFKIDHPDDPENKYLIHSFVESPDMMNIYNGNATTNAQGEAWVQLPEYFESLNKDFRYQLTVVGTFAQAIVGEKVQGGRLLIRTSELASDGHSQRPLCREIPCSACIREGAVQQRQIHEPGCVGPA